MDFSNGLKYLLKESKISGLNLDDTLERVFGEQKSALPKIRNELIKELGLVIEDITGYTPTREIIELIPYETARSYLAVPLSVTDQKLKVGLVDPTDFEVLLDLELISGMEIEPVVAPPETVQKMINKLYKGRSGSVVLSDRDKPVRHVKRLMGDNSIIKMVNDVIIDAVTSGISDIHFEPFEKELEIRFRLDGILQVFRRVHSKYTPEVISRIKVMANIDIAEKRRPQDGRIHFERDGQTIDIRVSTLPTEYGQKIVLRILDKSAVSLDLEKLGFAKEWLDTFKEFIQLPYGMILVTGPTGSGKTTTLYSALNMIKSTELNICTVEDPIEYKMDGIVQTNVKSEIDLTFANTLRTLLRQDPDVIMVGEIRDGETAELSIRAALTGHLVFSTLHTNDAPSAVTRLIDMGIEPFLVSSSVSMIVAQRLVRKNCMHCLGAYTADEKILKRLTLAPDTVLKKGKGCFHCNDTGFDGRVALFEVLTVTENVRELIKNKADASAIRKEATKEGMRTLREDGLYKIIAGITTAEEVLRVTAI
ncbi:MAG: GspE/PulE family protein [Fibrobacterales bacterium]